MIGIILSAIGLIWAVLVIIYLTQKDKDDDDFK